MGIRIGNGDYFEPMEQLLERVMYLETMFVVGMGMLIVQPMVNFSAGFMAALQDGVSMPSTLPLLIFLPPLLLLPGMDIRMVIL